MSTVTVHKVHAGVHRIEVPHPRLSGEDVVLFAYRNEAGFAGRDWYVTDAVGRTIEDMLPSLKVAVETATDSVWKRGVK